MAKAKRRSHDIEHHHILPKNVQKKHLGRVYNEATIPLRAEKHDQAHRDIREVGVIGSLARLDLRRWSRLHES